MAVTINASTTAGLVNTADTSGILQLQTANTTAVTVDASQNVSTTNGATIQGLTVGRGAGAASGNTVVGASALQANTTATNNSAVGYQAMYSNTTGRNNAIYGYQAGYSMNQTDASESGNHFFGFIAGYGVTSGKFNSFFGYNSGYLVTTGSKNTIIGTYSGNQGGLDIRTASNYIVMSDGDGNPKGYFDNNNFAQFWLNANSGADYSGSLNFGLANVIKSQIYYYNVNSRLFVQNSSAGVYLTAGGTSWTSNSDERTKDIIEPITNAANKVSSIRAVIGKFKTDAEGTRRSFLIAQDVQAVLPEAISVDTDEQGTLGIAYTDVIPLLVAAIKELKTEFDAYKASHP